MVDTAEEAGIDVDHEALAEDARRARRAHRRADVRRPGRAPPRHPRPAAARPRRRLGADARRRGRDRGLWRALLAEEAPEFLPYASGRGAGCAHVRPASGGLEDTRTALPPRIQEVREAWRRGRCPYKLAEMQGRYGWISPVAAGS